MADEEKTQELADKRASAAAKYRALNEKLWSDQLLGGNPLRGPRADFDELIATFRKELQPQTRDEHLRIVGIALSVLPLLHPRGPGRGDSLDQRGNDNDQDNRAGRKESKD